MTCLGLLQLMAALEGLGREYLVPGLSLHLVWLVAALDREGELTLELGWEHPVPGLLLRPVQLVAALQKEGEWL